MKILKFGLLAPGLALLLAACGGGTAGNGGGGGGGGCTQKGAASGATAAQTVKINSDPNTIGRYDPQNLTVKVGDSVEWDWIDTSAQHSVTADDGTFESCLQSSGSKFIVTFSSAGDFKYHCQIHSGMTGDIKVG